MRYLFLFLFLFSFTVCSSQTVTPDIRGMWITNNTKKPKVYTFNDDEVVCHISDVNNRYASSVKNMSTVEIKQTDMKNGRIIAKLDSENVSMFFAFDYFNLQSDSVRVAEIPTRFKTAEEAKNCPVQKPASGYVFYTTEYMGRLNRIKNTPALTKEGYMSFLREVMKELQKPESKKIKPEPGKTPDQQMKEFMNGMLSRKQYQGKIIPETLEIAMNTYKDDAGVKKLMPYIRQPFTPKPAASPATQPAPSTSPGLKK